jgi:hypothetical protein
MKVAGLQMFLPDIQTENHRVCLVFFSLPSLCTCLAVDCRAHLCTSLQHFAAVRIFLWGALVPKYVSSIRTVVHTTSASSISTDLGIHIIYTYNIQ